MVKDTIPPDPHGFRRPSQQTKHEKNPISRVCRLCGRPFQSTSGNRRNCYQCIPIGKKGRPPHILEVETMQGIKVKAMRINGCIVTPHSEGGQSWGQCCYVDRVNGSRCVRERFSPKGGFCFEHMNQMAQVNADKKAAADAMSGVLAEIEHKKFQFQRAQDAIDFLSELNWHVYKGHLHPAKARSIAAIVRIQIKGLDSKIIALRLYAIIQGLKQSGGDVLPALDEIAEIERDAELGRAIGLRDIVEGLDRGTRDKQGPAADSHAGDVLIPPGSEEPVLPEPKSNGESGGGSGSGSGA
jgi:hypothetical protein